MDELTLEQQQAIALASARVRAAQSQEQPRYDYTGDIPTLVTAKTQPAPENSKLINFLSGGRSGNLQQYLYNNEQPANSMLGRAGQLLGASGIEGLTGVGAVGQAGSTITKLGSNVPNVMPYVSKVTSPIASKVSELPSWLMGTMSNRSPEAYKTIYEVSKSGNKELKQALSEATPLGKKLYDDMVYNYARALQLPHEKAMLAEDFTKNHEKGLGAWDLLASHYGDFADSTIPAAVKRIQMSAYKPFNELSDSEKLKQTVQAGVDTATFSPFKPKSGIPMQLGDVGNAALKYTLGAPLEFLASPRISRAIASSAGTASRYIGNMSNKAKQASKVLPDPSLEDLFRYGLLSPTLVSNQGQ